MRAVLQRVSRASVIVDDCPVGSIESLGWLILVGVQQGDTHIDVEKLLKKILNIRAFNDNNGKMNLSLVDIDGPALVVSQFTLLAGYSKGRRPSFTESAEPKVARAMYDFFVEQLRATGRHVETGRFGAEMQIKIEAAGPVTLLLDSRQL